MNSNFTDKWIITPRTETISDTALLNIHLVLIHYSVHELMVLAEVMGIKLLTLFILLACVGQLKEGVLIISRRQINHILAIE
jgi:hypothetical protein